MAGNQWRSKKFKKGKCHNFHFFFRQNLFEADWETRKAVGGPGACSPGKFTGCNGYFSAFWIIFRKTLFKFFDPNSKCFAKYNAFCSHIFDYACSRCKAYRYRRGSKLWKNCIHPKHFENGWWEDAYSLSYSPGSAPGHNLQMLYIF